jgi:hypothetical protein
MSPAVQELFVTEIAPILQGAVPRSVLPVGSEDADELVQDALAAACGAVESLEQGGKPILPRSVAYYTIQRLKSGRRSTGSGRTDVMSPGCQLDGNASLASMDQPFSVGDEDDGGLALGDLIACRQDDPSQKAARNLDWSEFMTGLTASQQEVVWATASGFGTNAVAARLGVSPPRITQQKRTVAEKAVRFWGDDVLVEAQEKPLWRRQIQCR